MQLMRKIKNEKIRNLEREEVHIVLPFKSVSTENLKEGSKVHFVLGKKNDHIFSRASNANVNQ
jgi:Cu/Ag efflux protein CusF